MASVLVFSGVLTFLGLIGLLGKQCADRGITPSQAGVAVLPSVAVCATATLRNGFNWLSMCLSIGALILGVILAGILGPTGHFKLATQPVRAGIALMCFAVLLLGLGGHAISWTATLISAFTPLNISVVAFAMAAASAVCVFGLGATRGLARTAMVIVVATAVIMLLGGIFIGSVAALGDPVIHVGKPGFGSNVIFTIAVVLVTGLNPGLRDIGKSNRPQILVGASVVIVCTALTLFGMLALVGGAIQLPSAPLSTFVAYLPPALVAVIGGVLAIVGVVVGAQLMDVLFDMSAESHQFMWPNASLVRIRLIASIVAGAILAILSIWQPSPSWAVPTLALLGVIGFVAQKLSVRRDNAAAEATTDDEVASETASTSS